MIVQCFVTAWRVDHRRRPRRRRLAHRARSTSRPRETREEARQRKYRYLYQVRTARGDIISQVGTMTGAQRSAATIFLVPKLINRPQLILSLCFSSLISSAQNYVSALQKRVQPGRNSPSEQSTKSSSHERNTLNSDRTHFTNIPDSDADKMDFVQERR